MGVGDCANELGFLCSQGKEEDECSNKNKLHPGVHPGVSAGGKTIRLCLSPVPSCFVVYGNAVYFRTNCRKKKEGWGSLTLKLSSCMKPRHLYPRRGLTEWYTHVIDVIHIYLKGNLSFAAMHTKGIFLNNSSLVISKHPENQNILLCNFTYGNLECVIIISNRILLNKGLIIW